MSEIELAYRATEDRAVVRAFRQVARESFAKSTRKPKTLHPPQQTALKS